jgi:hypothetical protein
MTTECNQSSFEFHSLNQRKVIARFDGGNITSDAGVLLLREVEKRTGLIGGLAQCFRDYRDVRWGGALGGRVVGTAAVWNVSGVRRSE